MPILGSPDDKKQRIIIESIRAQKRIAKKAEVNIAQQIQGQANPFHIRKLSKDLVGDPNAYKDQHFSSKSSKLKLLPSNFDISLSLSHA